MGAKNSANTENTPRSGSVALVGQPNVGKSVVFQQLTGNYVTVANYPGTTVEITRGIAKSLPRTEIIDTPGVVTLPAHSEDEEVTAQVLLNEQLQAIVQVGDAKNLRRTLLLSLQLAEMGVPMALALNMMDEADERGLEVSPGVIAEALHIDVVPTVATHGKGMQELTRAIRSAHRSGIRLHYAEPIEHALRQAEELLPPSPITPRALGLLWLSHDPIAQTWLDENADGQAIQILQKQRQELEDKLSAAPSDLIQQTRLAYVERLSKHALHKEQREATFAQRLGLWAIHPLWGLPMLALTLYVMYWFVGVFGAGALVNLLESRLFSELINPWVIQFTTALIPVTWLQDLLVGPYGLWTMGITYAVALILPIVTTFFIAFGILEDSGYLPRIAVLTNRLFRLMGLNGKAVLPMILGLGCVTMATLTTRILENKRDRLLTILLLALAIPCSAQLGVVMGMLASVSFSAALIWFLVLIGSMLLVGWLAARIIPGQRSSLLLELPPLRWPKVSSVVIKTITRLEWYLKEVVPLFLLGAGILFLMDISGALTWLIQALQPLMTQWLGLPAEASTAFLLGFLRRDFGATSLFLMANQGMLSPVQILVSMVTITLFIPCMASVLMIGKNHGWRICMAMIAVIFPFAFLVGGLLNKLLLLAGWGA